MNAPPTFDAFILNTGEKKWVSEKFCAILISFEKKIT